MPVSNVPADQFDDPGRRAALGIGDDVEFRTKPQLGQDILAEMIADDTLPPWVAGDEVYGRSGELRTFVEDNTRREELCEEVRNELEAIAEQHHKLEDERNALIARIKEVR